MVDDLSKITLNGLVLNNDPYADIVWHCGNVEGIGEPGGHRDTGTRFQADGNWSTKAFRDAGAMGLSGTCRTASPAHADRAVGLLEDACALSDVPLTLHWASGERTRWVKRDGRIEVDRNSSADGFAWSVTMVADDPRWFVGGQSGTDGVTTYTATLPYTTGGLSFPIIFPIIFDSESSTGDLAVTTTRGGRMQWRIDGPITNPSVTVTNSDGTRTVAWNLTMQADEWLSVDTETQQSRLQGTASRPPYLRQWPTLRPGVNQIRFRADSYDPLAKLTVAVRPIA